MVFALETYCPATDGRSAARIEEEVVVTPTGPRVLTRFPAEELLVTGKTYVRGADLLDGARRVADACRPRRRSRSRRSGERAGRSRTARPLPADAADPPLRGARPVALPPRRGLRDDAPLLGPGGRRGRVRERPRATATASRAPTAATGTCSRCGADPEALLAEMLGRATGINGGRAGSMNIVDPDHGLIGCFGIVGGSIAAATGAALALQGSGLASRSRTSATAPRTRRTSSSASTSPRC